MKTRRLTEADILALEIGAAILGTGGGGNTYLSGNRWNLAYSFMGGVAVPLSETSRVTAMYRWMQVRDAKHKCAVTGAVQSACLKNDINSLAVDLGLEMDL